ncbi:ParA family protein [Microscilla marina]|uniref:Phage-related regulatory protein cII n=1 Tax=Microscilla marina ATCC 23134 TaxID=313606 RepID=A1ZDX7_MICM2|nr:ParA family protein [Microscilla marina]EAY31285.1 phage-related regulatory protein cII [Microscilla marina ATCC 23134]
MKKTITFFNNKGGVGKTTMVYHIAWMLAEQGKRVIVADFDPQSNLSAMFLTPDRLEEIIEAESNPLTVLDAITPITEGDRYLPVHIENINDKIGLLVGDLALSTFEDRLSDAWLKCLNADIYSFRITSIFNTIINDARKRWEADFALVDIGPNLGAINRAVIISSDNIIIPVASDLFSLQGMKNLGKTLTDWKQGWDERCIKNPKPETLTIPNGEMQPTGYVVMQYTAKEKRPVKSYLKWANRIPNVYREFVLKTHEDSNTTVENDCHCIGLLKHYHSLAPMAMEAHKPIFLLKPADGAIGSHMYAVHKSYEDFDKIAKQIVKISKQQNPCK